MLKGTPGKELYYRPSSHLNIVGCSDVDWAGDHIDHCFTTGYCIFIGGNLMTWRCKKQNVAQFNVEAGYRVMTHIICELMWIQSPF